MSELNESTHYSNSAINLLHFAASYRLVIPRILSERTGRRSHLAPPRLEAYGPVTTSSSAPHPPQHMRASLFPRMALACGALFCLVAEIHAEPITQIAELRRLTPAQADEYREVKIRAMVTYFNPTRRGDLVVQDETGGAFVSRTKDVPDLHPGDVIEIGGATYWGIFAPMISALTFHIVDHVEPPEPKLVTYDQILSGSEIGQWVRTSGIVRSAHIDMDQKPPRLILDIATSRARFRAWLLEYSPSDAEQLIDAEVQLDGVPVALSNSEGNIFSFRLLMSKRSAISVVRPPPTDPYNVALVPLNNVRQFRPGVDLDHRVRVSGVVEGWQPGQWLAISDAEGALQMRTEQVRPSVQPGDTVDVLGFPARGEYGAVLEDAIFRRSGEHTAAPAPVPITPQTALVSDARLVSIDARLLGIARRADAFLLTLQTNGSLIEATLAWTSPTKPWPDLEPSSFVRITGICTVSAGDDIRFLHDLSPQSFRIALRGPADLLVLEHPPWLTRSRAEIIMAFLIVGAIFLLRHHRSLREQIQARIVAERELKEAHGELELRVEERSRQIEKEISARRVAEGALRERNRLAAEIHDSLQQGLTALGTQLAIAGETLSRQPEAARGGIEQARALVRHSQEEIRRTVWNLRSQRLEHQGLVKAIEEMGHAQLVDRNVNFIVACDGETFELPEVVQDHLLRIAQETLTNALKHGSPAHVDVRLTFRPRTVSLSITDDGRGFSPEQAPGQESGHFGLMGMRERVRRLGGTLVVDAAPGKGTKVSIVVPLSAVEVMQDSLS